MARPTTITGIDLGSSATRVVMAQPMVAAKGQATTIPLQILSAVEVPSQGIQKGVVTSLDDAVSSLSNATERAERMAGRSIEHAYIGITGLHVISQISRGVIAVAKPDGEIGQDDVARVIEAAQTVATPPNYEILHVIPRSFSVDQQSGVKDPVGMTGIRLEVDAHIIQGLSSHLRNISKVVFRTGVDIDDMVLSVLAASESVLSRRQKELGVALMSIGGMTTALAVFEEGDLLATVVLPVGGAHITNDIAIGLRTSIDLAEIVKREYGAASPGKVTRKDEVSLSEIAPTETGVFSRRYVAEIIEARLEELFELADKELVKIDRSGTLPAGIVLTGGGCQIPGISEVAKKVFRLPANVGESMDLPSAIEKIKDPGMSAALGLALWGYHGERQENGQWTGKGFPNVGKLGSKMSGWVKGWFR